MKLENYIALRFIKARKKNKEISSFSIVVISVIAVSIVFFISAVSIMNGYIYGVMKIAYEVKSFNIDYPINGSYSNTMNELLRIRKDKEVQYADLYREAKVLLSANGKNTGILYFRSIPEEIFKNDNGFERCIKLNAGNKSLGKNEILISEKSAEKLKVKAGDILFVTGMLKKNDPQITLYRLKVAGLFSTGYQELDEQLAFVGSETGDRIFKNDVDYNIFIKLDNFKKSKEFVLKYMVAGYFGMISWQDANRNEITALNFEKNVIGFIVVLVIFVAVLNILTNLYITTFEKKKDIGILKTVGYSPKKVIIIFLLNGLYLSFVGIIVGIIVGLLVMINLNEILIFFSTIVNISQNMVFGVIRLFIFIDTPPKFEIFSKDFYLDKIYTEISFVEILLISIITLIFSIIASIIPALNAGQLKPVEVLKNE